MQQLPGQQDQLKDILLQKLQEADTDHLIMASLLVLLLFVGLIKFLLQLPGKNRLRQNRLVNQHNITVLKNERRIKLAQIASDNVQQKGWPPAHLDAYGDHHEVDFPPVPEVPDAEEEEE